MQQQQQQQQQPLRDPRLSSPSKPAAEHRILDAGTTYDYVTHHFSSSDTSGSSTRTSAETSASAASDCESVSTAEWHQQATTPSTDSSSLHIMDESSYADEAVAAPLVAAAAAAAEPPERSNTASRRRRLRETSAGGSSVASSSNGDEAVESSLASRSHPPSAYSARGSSRLGGARSRSASVDSPVGNSNSSTASSPLLHAFPASAASPPASSSSGSSSAAAAATDRPRATSWRKAPPAGMLGPDSSTGTEAATMGPPGGRTPRSSMYAAFAADALPPSAEAAAEPSSPKDRRRLFGRSKHGAGSSRDSLLADTSGTTLARSPSRTSFVRRMGSRTFFGGARNEAAMASTESFGSTTGSIVTETGSSSSASKRASDLLSRATLPSWARRRSKVNNEGGSASPNTPDAERRSSIDSLASTSVTSLNEFGRPVQTTTRTRRSGTSATSSSSTGLGIDTDVQNASNTGTVKTQSSSSSSEAAAAATTASGEALPKRLSGWLLNMLGNEEEPANVSLGDAESSTLRARASSQRAQGATAVRDGGAGQQLGSPTLLPAHLSGSPNVGAASTLPSSARKAGLLTNLSTSARQRVGNLGEAMRSLREGEGAQASTADEGVWLLGVLHAPAERTAPLSATGSEPPRSAGPTIEISNPSPEARRNDKAASSSPVTGPARRASDADSLSSGGGSMKPRRARQATPSIAESASSGASRGAELPRTPSPVEAVTLMDTGEEAVIVRNPPTPHASPAPANARAYHEGAHSAFSEYNAAVGGRAGTASLHSLAASTTLADEAALAFQHDFTSRIWCTYRCNFTAIARDGSISAQAEGAAEAAAIAAAAAEAAAEASPRSTTPNTTEKLSMPISMGNNSTQRNWLGRRLGEGSTSTDLLSSSPSSASASQSPGLGMALGVSRSSAPSATAAGGLGERMGIPSLWGRTTAALSATLGVRSDLTRDSGWGCMLRTGQSLLANALITVHLGRDWRRCTRPPPAELAPSAEEDGGRALAAWREERARYAAYVRLLSWFFDEPSPACPFSVHRMAREGKRLGKEPGEWFGPSTAAGAIKQLVDDFPQAAIGVSLAADGVVYLSRVRNAAAVDKAGRKAPRNSASRWQRPVLVLVGVRLGLEGVNPVYHESIKALFTFPQSVGIAGGRPSSSFYFVGYQGSKLFYLDPHNQRPAVPFRHPPPSHQSTRTSSSDGVSSSPKKASSRAPKAEEPREDADEWWSHVYSEAELATFHYAHAPKKMVLESLDPSMLLGFLCTDEASLDDLVARVRALPKAIFSMQEAPPRWMMEAEDEDVGGTDDYDEEAALESFSESSMAADSDDEEATGDDEDAEVIPAVPRASSHQPDASDSTDTAPSRALPEHAPTSWRAPSLSRHSSQASVGGGRTAPSMSSSLTGSSQFAFPQSDGAADEYAPRGAASGASSNSSISLKRRGESSRNASQSPSATLRESSGSSQAPSAARPRVRVDTSARAPNPAPLARASAARSPTLHAAGLPRAASSSSPVSPAVALPASAGAAASPQKAQSDERQYDSDVETGSAWEEVGPAGASATPARAGAVGRTSAPRLDDSDDDF